MPVFSDGQKISAALAWDRMIQSVPASYVVWKDGSTYRAECLLKGGTDYSGTDAATVIQAAIDALTSGGKILTRNGAYSISTGLTASNPVIITGESKNQTILQPSENVDCFTITSNDVTIQNLKVEHQSTGTGEAIVIGDNIKRATIDNLYITNGYHGIEVRGHGVEDLTIKNNRLENSGRTESSITVINPDTTDNKRIRIYGNTVISSVNHAIQIYSSQGLYTKDVLVYNNLVDTAGGAGIWASFVEEGKIFDNIVRNVTDESLDVERSTNFEIGGNIVYGGEYGISIIQVDTNPCNRISVKNNIIHNPTNEAIIVKMTGTPDSVTNKYIDIVGNIIFADQYDGIRLVYGVEFVNIIGNIVKTDSATAKTGIRIDPTSGYKTENVNIEGNIVAGFGTGLSIASPTSNYVKYVNVIGNNFKDNTSSIYYDSQGVDVVFARNQGYVTENSGTSTISSSTYVDVTHGLAGTPTTINVTPATSGTGDWYLSNIGDTTFRINVANSGTYTFHWTAEYKP